MVSNPKLYGTAYDIAESYSLGYPMQAARTSAQWSGGGSKLLVKQHMADASVQGERIEIRGFGCFELRHRPPRIARNQKTEEAITLPASVTD